MSRLTPEQYLTRRRLLGEIWQASMHDYAYLSSREQRAIHDYYRSTENLTDADALKHRQEIGRSHPSLPQVAGRAYATLIGICAGSIPIPVPQTVHVAASHGRASGRAISVRAVLRPQPDIERLVKALMSIKPEELDAMLQRMKDDKPAA